jgi:hypothetical protein
MDIQISQVIDQDTFIHRFKELYRSFDQNTLTQLPALYKNSIIFIDPIHKLEGLDKLFKYFSSFNNPDLQCQFIFTNEIIGRNQAFFQWQMQYSHKRIYKGKLLVLSGGSLIKFSDKIYYHEDFYDMGAMLYQHIPIIGWLIRKINARMVQSK